jgi:pimeloyl-ACP methyl ester carboxylesterase
MKYGPEQSGRLIRGGQALGVGLAAVSSLIYLDGQVGKRRWPSKTTRLVGVPSADVEELILSFPGLGSLGGEEQGRHMRRLIPATPSAHFEYSTDRISIRGLAADVRGEAPRVKRVHIGGHSMGGPLGLETVRHARDAETKLGRVVLFCSPYGLDDGKSGKASKALKAIKWTPGPGHKFAFQAARSLLEGKSPKAAFEQAREDATTGCSPRVWLSMRDILEGIKLSKHVGEYQDMVDEESEIWYCMPENPDNDPTVFTEAACEQYREFAEQLGVPYQTWQIPGIGHAEVVPTVDYLVQALEGGTEQDVIDLVA